MALAIGSGTALAEHHEEAAPAPDAAATASAGKLKAGAKVMIPKGLDEDGEIALGAWVEVTPWAKYKVNDKIAAGVSIPLLLLKPDFGDAGPEALQAIMADAHYAVNDQLTGDVMVGMGRPARLGFNPWGGGFGIPASAGDLKMGFGVGGSYNHKMDKIHINAGAQLRMQLDSDVDDDGEEKPLLVVHVPVMAMYAINPQLSAGVATGIYTGSDVSFDNEEGMTLPFVAGAKYAINPNLAAGGFLGVGNLLTPEGLDVGDTLTLGIFAAWMQ